MPKSEFLTDLVFNVDNKGFELLQEVIAALNNKERYWCNECGCKYTLMSNSIFSLSKKDFNAWVIYLTLMTFNIPLEMTEEICDISHPTAMLWREKVFSTVDGYQEHLYLKDRVWINETYLYDSSLLHDDGYKKRGLSKKQLCIVVANDCHKNTYAVICGHGKPSASRIFEVLKNHIVSGSTLIRNGEEAYDKEYLEKTALINKYVFMAKKVYLPLHWDENDESTVLFKSVCISV